MAACLKYSERRAQCTLVEIDRQSGDRRGSPTLFETRRNCVVDSFGILPEIVIDGNVVFDFLAVTTSSSQSAMFAQPAGFSCRGSLMQLDGIFNPGRSHFR